MKNFRCGFMSRQQNKSSIDLSSEKGKLGQKECVCYLNPIAFMMDHAYKLPCLGEKMASMLLPLLAELNMASASSATEPSMSLPPCCCPTCLLVLPPAPLRGIRRVPVFLGLPSSQLRSWIEADCGDAPCWWPPPPPSSLSLSFMLLPMALGTRVGIRMGVGEVWHVWVPQ